MELIGYFNIRTNLVWNFKSLFFPHNGFYQAYLKCSESTFLKALTFSLNCFSFIFYIISSDKESILFFCKFTVVKLSLNIPNHFFKNYVSYNEKILWLEITYYLQKSRNCFSLDVSYKLSNF